MFNAMCSTVTRKKQHEWGIIKRVTTPVVQDTFLKPKWNISPNTAPLPTNKRFLEEWMIYLKMTKPRKEPVSRPHHLCHIDWFITLRVCVPHLVTAPSRDVEHRPRYIPYDRNALVVDPNIIIAIVFQPILGILWYRLIV